MASSKGSSASATKSAAGTKKKAAGSTKKASQPSPGKSAKPATGKGTRGKGGATKGSRRKSARKSPERKSAPSKKGSTRGKAKPKAGSRSKPSAKGGKAAKKPEVKKRAKSTAKDSPRLRVFVLGFPKSGTTTLHRAFQRAGLVSAHWQAAGRFCGEAIYEDFHAGRDPLAHHEAYDCITQPDVCRPKQIQNGAPVNYWPQLDFEVIKAIQRFNPDLKFILNRRDVDALVNSIQNWANLSTRITEAEIIGLPAGKGGTSKELRAWIEGHYKRCAEHFAGDPNFLDFEIGDSEAHEKVESFVGRELPWWGIANSHASGPKDEEREARKAARSKRKIRALAKTVVDVAIELSKERGPKPTIEAIAAGAETTEKSLRMAFPTDDDLDKAIAIRKVELQPAPEVKVDPGRNNATAETVRSLTDVPPYLVAEQLVAEARRLTGQPVALYVPDPAGSHLTRAAGPAGFPPNIPAPGVLGAEIVADSLPGFNKVLRRSLPRCTAVPLQARGRTRGLLVCTGDATNLQALSTSAVAALELAGASSDTVGPMGSPNAVQQDLLPPRVARIAGGELAADVLSSAQGGGDWFDYADNEDGTWLALADVSGSGPAAAGIGAATITALRSARRQGADLSGCATAIDGMVKALRARGSVAVMLAIWHPVKATLTWINCGHPPPYLADETGVLAELEGPSSPALGTKGFDPGLVPNVSRLDPGTRLILASDGTIERTSPVDEPPSYKGIETALQSVRQKGAPATALAIQRAATGTQAADEDDAAFLVLSMD